MKFELRVVLAEDLVYRREARHLELLTGAAFAAGDNKVNLRTF